MQQQVTEATLIMCTELHYRELKEAPTFGGLHCNCVQYVLAPCTLSLSNHSFSSWESASTKGGNVAVNNVSVELIPYILVIGKVRPADVEEEEQAGRARRRTGFSMLSSPAGSVLNWSMCLSLKYKYLPEIRGSFTPGQEQPP